MTESGKYWFVFFRNKLDPWSIAFRRLWAWSWASDGMVGRLLVWVGLLAFDTCGIEMRMPERTERKK